MATRVSSPLGLSVFPLDFRRNFPLLSDESDARYQTTERSLWRELHAGKTLVVSYVWSYAQTIIDTATGPDAYSYQGSAGGTLRNSFTLTLQGQCLPLKPVGGLTMTSLQKEDFGDTSSVGAYTLTIGSGATAQTVNGTYSLNGVLISLSLTVVRAASDNSLRMAAQISAFWTLGPLAPQGGKADFEAAAVSGTFKSWEDVDGANLLGNADGTASGTTVAGVAGEEASFLSTQTAPGEGNSNGIITYVNPNGQTISTDGTRTTTTEVRVSGSYAWE